MTASYVPQARLAFEIEAICQPPEEMGRIDGGTARMIPITGGTVRGRLNGAIIPGGADWSIMRDNGLATVDARYAIRADDGTIIQVWNAVTDRMAPREGGILAITSPRFLAPDGAHDWLNRGVFVATLAPVIDPERFAVNIAVFEVV